MCAHWFPSPALGASFLLRCTKRRNAVGHRGVSVPCFRGIFFIEIATKFVILQNEVSVPCFRGIFFILFICVFTSFCITEFPSPALGASFLFWSKSA